MGILDMPVGIEFFSDPEALLPTVPDLPPDPAASTVTRAVALWAEIAFDTICEQEGLDPGLWNIEVRMLEDGEPGFRITVFLKDGVQLASCQIEAIKKKYGIWWDIRGESAGSPEESEN